MRRRWLRTNTLMLMVLVAIWGVFFGVVKRQQADPATEAVRRLRSGNVPERCQAARVLGMNETAAELAIPALIDALNDPDEDVRWMVIFALGCRGTAAAPAVPGLVPVTKDPSIRLRREAVDSLGVIRSSAAVPALIAAFQDPDDEVRFDAVRALGSIGPGATSATAALAAVALDARDPRVSNQAFASLGQLGAGAREAVPIFIRALGPTEATPDQTRQSILTSLRAIAPDDPASVRARLDALHDAERNVRFVAARTLDIPINDEVIAALIEVLHGDVAGAAAESLGRMGLADPAIVPALCDGPAQSPEVPHFSWGHS